MCTLQQTGPEVPTLDDSVEAFMKLRDLQPQQQELQRSLDEDGGLNDEDAECLDFVNDEIARLLDILQKHGFHFPESASFAAASTVSVGSTHEAHIPEFIQMHLLNMPDYSCRLGIGSLHGQAPGEQAAGRPLCMETSESEDDTDAGMVF